MVVSRKKSESPASDSGVGSTERKEVDEEEDEDGMWVEKVAKRDDNAFVGPVPEIKVQATVTKKE